MRGFGMPACPEMTSMSQSAGFSFGGSVKPSDCKYGATRAVGPEKTVWPPFPRSSTSSISVKRP